tara:strand:- start:572 stop:988 length:417 start_codon:yes stop_codon:yes gene_type:complete
MIEFWLVAKVWSAKVWEFAKKYWKILAAVAYTVFVWIFFKSHADKAKAALGIKDKAHKEEVETLTNSHKKEIALRDEELARYHQIIAQIEKDYENRKEELSDKKREEVKQLVAENSEDPSNLSKLLAERFGVSHIGEE